MTTNRQVITDALIEINVLDPEQSASASDVQLGLREMNRLMASLLAEGIDLGYPPQANPSDDFPLDEVAEAQVTSLLALRLTKHYPAVLRGPVLLADAEMAKQQLLRQAVIDTMQESSLTHMPLGESHCNAYDIDSDN